MGRILFNSFKFIDKFLGIEKVSMAIFDNLNFYFRVHFHLKINYILMHFFQSSEIALKKRLQSFQTKKLFHALRSS